MLLRTLTVQQSTPKSIPHFHSGESGVYLQSCGSRCCKSLLTVITVELAHWHTSWHFTIGPSHIFTVLVQSSFAWSLSVLHYHVDRIAFFCEQEREEQLKDLPVGEVLVASSLTLINCKIFATWKQEKTLLCSQDDRSEVSQLLYHRFPAWRNFHPSTVRSVKSNVRFKNKLLFFLMNNFFHLSSSFFLGEF